MSCIELVIKIPEDEYHKILRTGKASFCAANAIVAGRPILKGHGRLIDVDAITKDLNTFQDAFVIYTDGTYRMAISCKAPTIIEADNAESEE